MALTKAVTETSEATRDLIAETLPERERLVIDSLFEYWQAHTMAWPTARELLIDMQRRAVLPAGADVNAVRPRLSDLYERGLVIKLAARRCSVGRIKSTVWRPTPPAQVETARQLALTARERLRRR